MSDFFSPGSFGRGFIASSLNPLSVFGADLVAWYDPNDSANTIITGSGVSSLRDKSGNGRHLTQSTDANRPTLGTSASFGNENVMTFNGTSHQLVNASFFDYNTVELATIYVAALWEANTATSYTIALTNGSTNTFSLAIRMTGTSTAVEANANDGTVRTATTTGLTAPYGPKLITLKFNGTAVSGFINGQAMATTNVACAGLTAATGKLSIGVAGGGAASFMKGKVGKMVFTKNVATAAQDTAMHAYFNASYGLF